MKLVEKHIVKKSSSLFKEIDYLSFLSKNLYNAVLYHIRQHYFSTKKYLNYYDIQKYFQNSKNPDYYALPTRISVQVLRQVDKDFTNFFAALREYKINPSRFKGRPRLPHYKDKIKGRNKLVYLYGAISFKNNQLKLSKTNIKIKSKCDRKDICQVNINKIMGGYCINVCYEKKEINLKLRRKNIAAIDLGLCNLATVTFNQNKNPLLIKGGVLKSTNHYFNKKLAKYKSICKKTDKLYLKRNNKIKDYLHKSSRYIVNQLVSNNVGTLVIGHNKYQKQEINIGKKNNQNFVSIPFYQFINMLKYKSQLLKIRVKIITEEYTSKCSFLDNERSCKHVKYKGKRIKRGLFKTGNGIIINADVNGSYNIMKKAIPNCIKTNGIQDVIVHPIRVKSYKSSF